MQRHCYPIGKNKLKRLLFHIENIKSLDSDSLNYSKEYISTIIEGCVLLGYDVSVTNSEILSDRCLRYRHLIEVFSHINCLVDDRHTALASNFVRFQTLIVSNPSDAKISYRSIADTVVAIYPTLDFVRNSENYHNGTFFYSLRSALFQTDMFVFENRYQLDLMHAYVKGFIGLDIFDKSFVLNFEPYVPYPIKIKSQTTSIFAHTAKVSFETLLTFSQALSNLEQVITKEKVRLIIVNDGIKRIPNSSLVREAEKNLYLVAKNSPSVLIVDTIPENLSQSACFEIVADRDDLNYLLNGASERLSAESRGMVPVMISDGLEHPGLELLNPYASGFYPVLKLHKFFQPAEIQRVNAKRNACTYFQSTKIQSFINDTLSVGPPISPSPIIKNPISKIYGEQEDSFLAESLRKIFSV